MEYFLAIIFSLNAYTQSPPPNQLPSNPDKAVVKVIKGIVYSYNSEPGQTDNNPFLTASGSMVRPGTIANNCLPFGTVVTIDCKHYEVLDRMNSRYGCEVFDIWTKNKSESLEWGKKRKEILIRKFRVR